MLRTAQTLISLASLAATCASGMAQDPGLDLPHVREAVPAEKRLVRIADRLAAGWDWEAARLCREMIAADAKAPLPHALLAMAMHRDPNRAARHCWDAVIRRKNGSSLEREVVDALQRYYGVATQPEIVDERFAEAPSPERYRQYRVSLFTILSQNENAPLWLDPLAGSEKARKAARSVPDERVEATLRRHNAYLHGMGAMPFEVPGYATLVGRFVKDEAERARQLARLPRHPDYPALPPVRGLPGLNEVGMDLWLPREATKVTLPSGYGGGGSGKVTFDPTAGKPTLVVFFLGFGCAHCVAQLKDLDPYAPKFRAAGIDVVSIGTDTLNEVRAAQQAALENGVDPLHFDVLCDPKGDVFKQWNVWDQFGDVALHGTFLVDGRGRILWQDISERPFEASDWLLEECKRLLAAWR